MKTPRKTEGEQGFKDTLVHGLMDLSVGHRGEGLVLKSLDESEGPFSQLDIRRTIDGEKFRIGKMTQDSFKGVMSIGNGIFGFHVLNFFNPSRSLVSPQSQLFSVV